MRSSLFGSYVRGEETPESDIDLLIEFGGKKNLLDVDHMLWTRTYY